MRTDWKDFIVESLLQKEGVNHFESSDVYFWTDKVQVRVLDNCIQFGVNESFDRWANSVDFIIYYPRRKFREEDVDAIVQYVHYLVDQKQFDKSWARRAEISIRQAKQYWKRKKYEEESIHIN